VVRQNGGKRGSGFGDRGSVRGSGSLSGALGRWYNSGCVALAITFEIPPDLEENQARDLGNLNQNDAGASPRLIRCRKESARACVHRR
jgi:hypothetical protein